MPRKKFPSSTRNDGFHFVVSCGPQVPEDPAVRRLIRRVAMRDVGIERRRGRSAREEKGWGVDDAQSWLVGATNSPLAAACDFAERSSEQHVSLLVETQQQRGDDDGHHQPGVVSLSYRSALLSNTSHSYQAARARFDVDLTTLSLLTGFSIGKTTMGQLAEDPTRMRSLVREASPSDSSFLSLVPTRYGSSAVVTAAADCLLAKARSVLLAASPLSGPPPPSFERDASELYAEALRRLREVIADPEAVGGNADVLCAVQLLALHELLDPLRSIAWAHHVSGSVRLMRHRTPKPFQNEFEKALFQSHVGAVVSDALHSNSHCYLAEPSWTALYESLIDESATHLTERHELVIHARELIFALPGLWHDISQVVRHHNDNVEQPTGMVEELYLRGRDLQFAYLTWLRSYEQYCVSAALNIPTEQEIHIRREVLGQALESLLIVNCLIATVSIYPEEIEAEIAALADRIMELQERPGPKHSWLFTGQEIGVAQVAIATKGLFTMDIRGLTAQERMSEIGRRYTAWSGLLRGC